MASTAGGVVPSSLRPYLTNLRQVLDKALCIQSFPCQNIERHNKPEIETRDNPELILPVVTVSRGASGEECCLVEPSINSVRISLRVGKSDALELELLKMYMRFLMQVCAWQALLAYPSIMRRAARFRMRNVWMGSSTLSTGLEVCCPHHERLLHAAVCHAVGALSLEGMPVRSGA